MLKLNNYKARGAIMSSADRKIGFYGLEYERYGSEGGKFFDKQEFINFVTNLPNFNHILDIPKSNKAITIESVNVEQVNFKDILKIVFKSCKYNHSPDYMSSRDGSERDSEKELFEGEKEITHICMNVRTAEAEVILEERRSGVTIKEVVQFLNQCLRKYLTDNGRPKNFKIIYTIVPHENFIRSLNGMERVVVAEIFNDKRVLGSETLALMDRVDNSINQDVIITLKANKGESLRKRTIRGIYESITGEENQVTRLRIYGKDDNSNSIKLDSDTIKKLEYVRTDLLDNGIVNTNSMFENMIELLGVNTNEDR